MFSGLRKLGLICICYEMQAQHLGYLGHYDLLKKRNSARKIRTIKHYSYKME